MEFHYGSFNCCCAFHLKLVTTVFIFSFLVSDNNLVGIFFFLSQYYLLVVTISYLAIIIYIHATLWPIGKVRMLVDRYDVICFLFSCEL